MKISDCFFASKVKEEFGILALYVVIKIGHSVRRGIFSLFVYNYEL